MDRSSLISDLERQFSENPRRVFARLANEYRKTGDSDRAIEMCRAHIPQQPGYISGHIVLGQALFDRGEMDDARETFETALALDPENLIALRQMGDISRQRGETGAAQGWYQRLLDVDPQNEEISAIVTSLSPPPSTGAPLARPAAADPMAGWGQVDVGAEIGTGASVSDNSINASDEAAVTGGSLELLDSSADLTDSSIRADSNAASSTDVLAEHEPLDTFASAASVEAASSREAGAEESGKIESGMEMLDWGAPSGDSALDSGSGFAIDVGLPTLDQETVGDFTEWSGKATAEDESIMPETEHSMLLDDSELHLADMVDLVETEPSMSGSLESASLNLAEAPASYSNDPVLGRTFEDTVAGTEETPAAFVTETMAELYLQQGFREEALSVYRRLVLQNPDDTELRARVARLEKGGGESIFDEEGSGGEYPEREQKPRTVKAFLAKLAVREPSRVHPSHTEERGDSGTGHAHNDSAAASAALALFGDEEVPVEDAKAADRLSRAYTGKDVNEEGEARGQPSRAASHGLSLDDVFRDAESRAEKTATGSGFSFDEFFNDASDAELARGKGDMVEEGSRDRQEPSKPKSSDLESFNAWLEGLKK